MADVGFLVEDSGQVPWVRVARYPSVRGGVDRMVRPVGKERRGVDQTPDSGLQRR